MRLVIASLMALSCAEKGEPIDGMPPPGEGSLEVQLFAASKAEVPRCETATLLWDVPGAGVVNIEMDGVTLVSSVEESGSVESRPICRSTTISLLARKGSEMIERDLQIRVAQAMPEIVFVQANPLIAVVGETVVLEWATRAAETVRVERDGATVGVFDTTEEQFLEERAGGFTVGKLSLALDATAVLVVSASGSGFTATSSVMVLVEDVGIDRLRIRPPAALGSATASISWAARGQFIQWQIDGLPAMTFPNTLSGTISVQLFAGTSVALYAFGDATSASWSVTFHQLRSESEPNEEPGWDRIGDDSIYGELSPGDVDVFTFSAGDGSQVEIWSGDADNPDCAAIGPTITLKDRELIEVERADAPCGRIQRRLENGDYFIFVTNESGQTGPYHLFFQLE